VSLGVIDGASITGSVEVAVSAAGVERAASDEDVAVFVSAVDIAALIASASPMFVGGGVVLLD
jgi:hypothetical protein